MDPKKKPAAALLEDQVPGAPGSEPPSLTEPTEPRETPPPKPDQAQPDPRSPTGAPSADPAVLEYLAMAGPGVVVGDQPATVLDELMELLGAHRVWDRFGAA